MTTKSAQVTEAHRDLTLRVRVCDMHYGIEPAAQLIADSEARAVADFKANGGSVEELVRLRADAQRLSAELAAIKRGHGELGRYEQLRLKNAELSKELAKERANSNRYKYIAWKSDTSPIMPYRLSDNTLLHGIYADEAIDQAMKEESK